MGVELWEPAFAMQRLTGGEFPVLDKNLLHPSDDWSVDTKLDIVHGSFRVEASAIFVVDVHAAGETDLAIDDH